MDLERLILFCDTKVDTASREFPSESESLDSDPDRESSRPIQPQIISLRYIQGQMEDTHLLEERKILLQ